MTIFSEARSRENRSTLDQFIHMLEKLLEKPRSKWSLIHVLESNTKGVDTLIQLGLTHDMIYRNDDKYCLTPHGREFIELMINGKTNRN